MDRREMLGWQDALPLPLEMKGDGSRAPLISETPSLAGEESGVPLDLAPQKNSRTNNRLGLSVRADRARGNPKQSARGGGSLARSQLRGAREPIEEGEPRPSVSSSERRASAASQDSTGAPATSSGPLPLYQVVSRCWADHHGWPVGQWPKNRAFDAIQIARWCRRGWPMAFWLEVIESTPVGCAFTYLTTPPEPGKVPRLEDAYIRWREGRYDKEKLAFKNTNWTRVGDVIRQHFMPGQPGEGIENK